MGVSDSSFLCIHYSTIHHAANWPLALMPGMETYPVAEKEIYVSEIIKDFFQSVIYTKGRLISLLNRD